MLTRLAIVTAPALFVLLWSTGFIGARYGMPYIEPLTFLAVRMGFAVVIMAAIALLAGARRPPARSTRLRELTGFGANPGDLRMFVYAPGHLPPKAPLVIALHGCTQTADEYDHGTGWSSLADSLGFVVVYPQQQPANNPKNCFSWFLPGDTGGPRRGAFDQGDGRARHCDICC